MSSLLKILPVFIFMGIYSLIRTIGHYNKIDGLDVTSLSILPYIYSMVIIMFISANSKTAKKLLSGYSGELRRNNMTIIIAIIISIVWLVNTNGINALSLILTTLVSLFVYLFAKKIESSFAGSGILGVFVVDIMRPIINLQAINDQTIVIVVLLSLVISIIIGVFIIESYFSISGYSWNGHLIKRDTILINPINYGFIPIIAAGALHSTTLKLNLIPDHLYTLSYLVFFIGLIVFGKVYMVSFGDDDKYASLAQSGYTTNIINMKNTVTEDIKNIVNGGLVVISLVYFALSVVPDLILSAIGFRLPLGVITILVISLFISSLINDIELIISERKLKP